MVSYDVVVLGGGLVGLTAANLFSKILNLKVAVLEPQQPELKWDDNSYGLRVSAVAKTSENVFKKIGAWADMIATGTGVYEAMRVWDGVIGGGSISMSADMVEEPYLGRIIENRVMIKALMYTASLDANINFYWTKAAALQEKADRVELYLSDGHILTANLLVGADGGRSWLRTQLGIETYGWDYQQSALVAVIESEKPHENIARQRFCEDGPLAFLPLEHPNQTSIVWSSAPGAIDMLVRMETVFFEKVLANSAENCLGAMTLKSERASFPLKMLHAKQYVKPNIVLVGDAAHVIHPLAGQGFNLGILDVASLVDVIQQYGDKFPSIGSYALLRKYERWRSSENKIMIGLIESFKQLFGSKATPVKWLRNIGLNMVNRNEWFKKQCISRAMGLTGNIPVICQL